MTYIADAAAFGVFGKWNVVLGSAGFADGEVAGLKGHGVRFDSCGMLVVCLVLWLPSGICSLSAMFIMFM